MNSDRPIRLGVAYYPECWDEEEWKRDVEIMAEAGINTVRLAEFAWAKMEIDEGQFDFDWLERFVELAGEADIDSILCTPTEAPPPWLTVKYPHVLPVGPDGLRFSPGGRRHYCVNQPTFQECSDRITRAMGERFGDNPDVYAWQLDNEAACHNALNCYCEQCAEAFRGWLEDKYGNIDALNEAWFSSFWSHNMPSFEHVQIFPNTKVGTSPQWRLDWMKFGGDSWVEFLDRQVEILRPLTGEQLISHNITWYQEQLDYRKLTEKHDVVGIDSYQREPYKQALVDALFDSVKPDRKHWIMEMPSGGNEGRGGQSQPLPPAKHKSYFLRHYLRGAEMCSMWHWRRHLGGQEMWNGACLDHNGEPFWSFDGVREVGAFVREHGELLAVNEPVKDVAILYSYDDLLLADMHGSRALGLDPHQGLDAMIPLLEGLERRGLGVAIAHPSDDLDEYEAVFAPMSYMMDEQRAQWLTGYVEDGGVLIGFGRMGRFDEFGKAHGMDQPGHLTELFGMKLGDFEQSPQADITVACSEQWGGLTLQCARGQVLVADSATPMAGFTDHRIAGGAAATVNDCGNGLAVYVGMDRMPDEQFSVLLDCLLDEARIERDDPAPESLEVIRGTHVTAYINTGEEEMIELELPESMTDLVSGETVDVLILDAWQVAIFENG